ncbi:hypothetical protein FF2_046167 [Malus domestica]
MKLDTAKAYDQMMPLYFKATKDETMEVIGVLQCYAKGSGKIINRIKSSIFFGAKCSRNRTKEIVNCTNSNGHEDFGKYLGLASDFGHSKKVIFDKVREALNVQINGWDE